MWCLPWCFAFITQEVSIQKMPFRMRFVKCRAFGAGIRRYIGNWLQNKFYDAFQCNSQWFVRCWFAPFFVLTNVTTNRKNHRQSEMRLCGWHWRSNSGDFLFNATEFLYSSHFLGKQFKLQQPTQADSSVGVVYITNSVFIVMAIICNDWVKFTVSTHNYV